jgi:Protein tyrosine phosphatase-like protein, PTPLA
VNGDRLGSSNPDTIMHPKDAYLVLYNLACCAGWAAIWVAAIRTVLDETELAAPLTAATLDGLLSDVSGSLAMVYHQNDVATLLWYTQGAALLEIVHALLRLVRSPVLVTAMQVMSRIVALVAIAYAPAAQGALSKCQRLRAASSASTRRSHHVSHISALLRSAIPCQRNGAPDS